MDVRKIIHNILYNMGFYIDSRKDINLIDYGMDSLRFIEFIVAIEQEFGKTIPDDALLMDSVSSLEGFITYVEALVLEE